MNSDNEKGANAMQFMDIQWLSAYGMTTHNVLEYFYTSPFFDLKSNNQTVRIQGVEQAQRDAILMNMIGKEYVIDTVNSAEPNLFVIREQIRHSSRVGDVSLSAVFYVLDGVIYKCPAFLELLDSRMCKLAGYLTQSFSQVRDGVHWSFGAGERRPEGFNIWSSFDWNENIDGDCDRNHGDMEESEEGSKYRKIIREFPGFQNVLLDAHDTEFS